MGGISLKKNVIVGDCLSSLFFTTEGNGKPATKKTRNTKQIIYDGRTAKKTESMSNA